MSATAPATWEPGTTFSTVVIDNLPRSQIVQYAGASGDFNPIHTDEVYATAAAGLPSVFAHGMLTMGAAATMLQRLVGPAALRSYTARFAERVWPGDTLTASATLTDARHADDRLHLDLELTVTNQDGTVVLRGHAQATVPRHSGPGRPAATNRSEITSA
ncbi:MaoC/PaaZ C-terminal domain-containing protein [Actinomadura sp. 7K507]|uniref:MaoC family dehydratase n=1 Tax=Actinomadura sp. 7K507 TaxID=2530365 RepID=UPI00104B4245|nr:MaoC/PaaZ C-terminal domain-containing protein [Actinomadura sp. 7K507]TDC92988.1 acyl dehydratase [Actinomadura sp. 7K507]